ncbi:hypothetical protein ABE10_10545 [Bacillus toyonensis]|nr:hypothetical protein [Bacillus toyonensis]
MSVDGTRGSVELTDPAFASLGRTVSRIVTAYCISAGFAVVWSLVIVALGPDTLGDLQVVLILAAVCIGGGALFCMRRRWRPLVAHASGAFAVAFAWFTALVASFETEASSRTTLAFVVGTFLFAAAYAIGFRPLGDEVTQGINEAVMRRVIREELERVRTSSPTED